VSVYDTERETERKGVCVSKRGSVYEREKWSECVFVCGAWRRVYSRVSG